MLAFGMYFDLGYMVLMLVLGGIAGLAQLWIKSSYTKYSQVPNRQRITGAEAAQMLLRNAGIDDVRVEVHQGFLSDHYSPKEKVVRLSPQNFSGSSIAAVGIAAHEVGHAMQHARHYAPLVVRNLAVPVAGLGSGLALPIIMIGMFLQSMNLAIVGILLFSAVAVFQIINLPVEFNASRRALQILPEAGILAQDEIPGARNMLFAAAMTYVAATIAAVVQVLYFAWRIGLLGGNSRD